jgi:CubicO group peptidase (beta-lactamase class C family)
VACAGCAAPHGAPAKVAPGVPSAAVDAAALDAFVDDAALRLRVPGAAIAVIADGRVAYEHVLGVRALGKPAPVTPQTLFMIGSITKTMTTLMEAALVDAGTLRWDTPVTTLLPSFAVGDAELTRSLLLWHTACACSGIPARDLELLFEYDGVTPEMRLAALKTVKPTAPLGAKYQYSNLMLAAGGFAAAHAFAPTLPLGDAYDAAMKAKVFDPIGMRSTTLDFAVAARSESATPHALALDGSTHPVPLSAEASVLSIRPAGGVWTNLRDMERWVATELAHGTSPDGVRVASATNVDERAKPRIRRDDGDAYGLGLDVGTYEGTPMRAHYGGSLGFGATMFLLPEKKLGIVIFTNVRNGGPWETLPFNEVVKRRVVEAVLPNASEQAAKMVTDFVAARRDADAKRGAEVERELDPAWLAPLVGTYESPTLGKVTLSATGVFDTGEWRSKFGRKRVGDGFAIVPLDPPFAGAELALGKSANGKPTIEVGDGYVLERR